MNAARHFSDSAWELLGRYIADNKYLYDVSVSSCGVTDSRMKALMSGLTRSRALMDLDLSENEISVDGIEAMVPFLKKCPNLSELDMDGNNDLKTDGFELLVDSLRGIDTIQKLRVERCGVSSIMALERNALPSLRNLDLGGNIIALIPSFDKFPKLESLYLDRNEIDPDGYHAIAELLRKRESSLTLLSLCSTGMGDREANIIAKSLQSNTKLTTLEMRGRNCFSRKGLISFIKLLNDISSIDNTVSSNHTILTLGFPERARLGHHQIMRYIDFAINMNRIHAGIADAAGKAKVVGSQLNTNKRLKLSRLQGLTQGAGHIFSQIESFLLPDVLALTGRKHGLNDFFRMFLSTLPHLMALRQ